MKIAFLNFYSGVVHRGGETFVHQLANGLSETHSVTVFQSGKTTGRKYKKIIVGPEAKHNYSTDNLPPQNILKRLFIDLRKLSELRFSINCLVQLIKLDPDVIIPVNSGWQVLFMSIYCRLKNKRFIVAGQSGIGWDDRWNLLMKPDMFVALTNRQLEWAKNATVWKTQKFVKISNGVDIDEFNQKKSPTKIKLSKPIVIIVAASIKSKRVEQTIVAISKLNSVSLLLLGSGHLDNQINNLAKKLLPNRFIHLSVSHEEIAKYYKAADVFTLCSDSSEAFGIVYLEAMASGLPCVATDDQSRREIVGDVGVYVKNPDNSREYAEAIQKALSTNWGNKPITQAKKFAWEKITKEYLSVLSTLK